MVKDSEAHKNHLYRAQKALEDKSKAGEGGADAMLARGGNMPHPMMGMATGAPGGASMVPGTSDVPASWRIHVGNLPVGTTGDELRAIFSAFGEVSSTSVRFDTGRPTGYGFVHFCAEKPAQLAMSAPPIELRGLTIKVNSVNIPQSSGGDWQLDDEPLGGVALNSNQRIDLMNRLAGKTAAPAPMPGGRPGGAADASGGDLAHAFVVGAGATTFSGACAQGPAVGARSGFPLFVKTAGAADRSPVPGSGAAAGRA